MFAICKLRKVPLNQVEYPSQFLKKRTSNFETSKAKTGVNFIPFKKNKAQKRELFRSQ